jgi:hypothetical protein
VRQGHENLIQRLEPDLFSIRTIPRFAAGQRVLFLRTEQGNILWGCPTLIDDATVGVIHALGGLVAIAVSHPRHFSSRQTAASPPFADCTTGSIHDARGLRKTRFTVAPRHGE